jgi:predicted Zn-dependent protease
MKELALLCVLSSLLASQDVSLDQLMAAGIALAQQEKMAEAAAVFERCAKLYPASFEAKYNLALAHVALNQYPAAFDTLNSVSPATADEKAAVHYLTGKIFLNTNHLKEAQQNLASAYAQRPGEENYALELALLYIRSAAYITAIDVLQPSLTVHPQSEELKLELALSDVLAGRYAEGLSLCRELQKQDPALSVSSLIAAFSYCAQSNYQACESEASSALASAHPNPYLYYLRARARWDASAVPDLQDVSAAIQKMPACDVCLLLRGRMFEAAHDNRSAIADLKQAIEVDGQSAAAWYQLSVLYRKAGQPKQASDALKHYRSLHDNGSTQEAESFRNQFLDTMGDH